MAAAFVTTKKQGNQAGPSGSEQTQVSLGAAGRDGSRPHRLGTSQVIASEKSTLLKYRVSWTISTNKNFNSAGQVGNWTTGFRVCRDFFTAEP